MFCSATLPPRPAGTEKLIMTCFNFTEKTPGGAYNILGLVVIYRHVYIYSFFVVVCLYMKRIRSSPQGNNRGAIKDGVYRQQTKFHDQHDEKIILSSDNTTTGTQL